MTRDTVEMLGRLQKAGISTDDALALRRIAMTLHRWFELECGNSNNHQSWCLVRGKKSNPRDSRTFEYDDNGAPYMERHPHYQSGGPFYDRIPDRETGARKRLAKLMAKYPGFAAYVQTDPRGAPLYIIDRSTTPQPYDQFYNRGIAVYK